MGNIRLAKGERRENMKHGFVRVAAATPDIRVADVAYNTEKIKNDIREAWENGAKIIAFP